MVKKLVSLVLVGAMLIAPINVNAKQKPKKHYRKTFAVCYDISVKDNATYVIEGNGNEWRFECDDSEIGDLYRITFDTKGTKTYKDDVIVGIKYINTIDNVSNLFDRREVKR